MIRTKTNFSPRLLTISGIPLATIKGITQLIQRQLKAGPIEPERRATIVRSIDVAATRMHE
jgi:hypothetical protein